MSLCTKFKGPPADCSNEKKYGTSFKKGVTNREFHCQETSPMWSSFSPLFYPDRGRRGSSQKPEPTLLRRKCGIYAVEGSNTRAHFEHFSEWCSMLSGRRCSDLCTLYVWSHVCLVGYIPFSVLMHLTHMFGQFLWRWLPMCGWSLESYVAIPRGSYC